MFEMSPKLAQLWVSEQLANIPDRVSGKVRSHDYELKLLNFSFQFGNPAGCVVSPKPVSQTVGRGPF